MEDKRKNRFIKIGKICIFVTLVFLLLIVVVLLTDPNNTFSIRELMESSTAQNIICRIIVILICIPVHEFAHAATAYKLGDNTPKEQGRLSINPFRHLTPIGAALILFIGIGYGKPVQFNPEMYAEEKRKRNTALIALAGPTTNIFMAIVFIILGCVVYRVTNYLGIANYIILCGYINISLATFNLIPIAPLDGSKVLELVIPEKLLQKIQQKSATITYVFVALVMAISRVSDNGLLGGINTKIFDFLLGIISTIVL